jgi:hypothetical protein
MLANGLARLRRFTRRCVATIRARVSAWTTPRPRSLATALAMDLVRSRRELQLENAFLRQQVVVLSRAGKRPAFTGWDRALLVLLASRLRTWASALLIIQPETVLRWHRQGFQLIWRRRSAPRAQPSPLAPATIDLIKQLARDNPLWGAERIRGELLKLGVRVSKRTIQKYLREARPSRRAGQPWATFLRNHAPDIWAGDFLPVTDLLFRPLYAFVVIALGSRRVVHVGVTRHPTDAWVAQQLREATPFDQRPQYLVRDNDSKYGPAFSHIAAPSGITELRTAYRARRQNATCERCAGSLFIRALGWIKSQHRPSPASSLPRHRRDGPAAPPPGCRPASSGSCTPAPPGARSRRSMAPGGRAPAGPPVGGATASGPASTPRSLASRNSPNNRDCHTRAGIA